MKSKNLKQKVKAFKNKKSQNTKILNLLEVMELLKEFNNLIKYLKKNLKREFLFNQNRILWKVQILISYLLVTSWIMVPLIITINQLMNISQAILIREIINLM